MTPARAVGRRRRGAALGFLALLALLVVSFPGRRAGAATPGEVEEEGASGLVAVEHDGSRADLARRLVELFDARAADLFRRLGLALPGEARFVLVADRHALDRALRERSLPPAPLEISGLAYPFLRLVFLDLSAVRNDPAADLDTVFTHELCHLFLATVETADRRLPIWLNEGICQWASEKPFFGSGADLITAAGTGDLPPLAEMTSRFPEAVGRRRVAYAASAAFVGHLEQRGGAGTVRALLDRFRRGESLDAAAAALLGAPLETVYAAWALSVTPPGPPIWNWLTMHEWESISAAMIIVFVLAVWRLRRRAARLRRAMAADEAGRDDPGGDGGGAAPWGGW
ncbi:MAG: hypothetical protein HY719_04910 [Planctomycetes bacterium]|nr:hypothetical protein [Planctomycetota bacterium]